MDSARPDAGDQTRASLSPLTIVGQLVIAGAVGALALPSVVGAPARLETSATISSPTTIWLVGALLIAIWIVALAPRLARIVQRALDAVPTGEPTGRRIAGSFRPVLLSALFVALIDAALLEATLRTPLGLVLGGTGNFLSIDLGVASFFVVLFMCLLAWLYVTASPYIESSVWTVLDSLIPTTGSGSKSAFDAVGEQRTLAALTRRDASAPATAEPPATALGSTQPDRVTVGGQATVLAPETALAAGETRPALDATSPTLPEARPLGDMTVLAPDSTDRARAN